MISPEFSLFIHSLATELDLQAGEEESNALLHSVGLRMAHRMPLPECGTTEGFELECNECLARIGWGHADLTLDQDRNLFSIKIHDVPRVGALGQPAGFWFSSLYAGLFTGWFAQIGESVTIRPTKDERTGNCMVFVVDPSAEA